MDPFLRKLRNSTPSLNQQESYDKVVSLLTSNQYVVCLSTVLGFDNAIALAHYFIDALAIMSMPDDSTIPALQPLHLLYFNNPDNPMLVSWGLYYQNGTIIYTENKEDPEESHLMILLDKSLKDELNLETQVVRAEDAPE